jgi:hypothetical protein
MIPYNEIQYCGGIGGGRALKLAAKVSYFVRLKIVLLKP